MQITSFVPLPPRAGRPPKYDWESMGVGDSFFREGISVNSMSSCANRAGNRLGMTFTCRTVCEGGAEGVRVWRES